MMTSQPFFNIGATMVASAHGIDRDELVRRRGAGSVMESPEAAPFKRELCKIASAAFDTAGDTTSPAAVLFRNLSAADRWYPQYDRFTDPVLRSLAKQANILAIPAMAHDKMGGGVMKTLGAAGVLGGTALGSLAFLLSRNAEQSSADNSALLQKVRAYKKLKRDIEEDMADEGAMGI